MLAYAGIGLNKFELAGIGSTILEKTKLDRNGLKLSLIGWKRLK